MTLDAISERVTFNCRETETKAITLTRDEDNSVNQSEFEVISCTWRLSAGKCARAIRGWFWLCFLLAEKVARVYQPITEQSKAKPKQTQLKTAPQL